MISTVINGPAGLTGWADTYWEHILAAYPASGDNYLEGTQDARPGISLVSQFENIETGRSGIILLLVEMFEVYREQRYLELAGKLVNELLEHCGKYDNPNYSLYTGRAGVVYALLRYYMASGNESMLSAALQLAAAMGEDYIGSAHVPASLYDGRAGTLLTFVHLYQFTGQASLLDMINQLVGSIVGEARMSWHGLFFSREDEFHTRPLCSFAFGTAGVSYVLALLNEFAHNAALEGVIAETDRYTASCWVDACNNWSNYKKDINDKADLDRYLTRFRAGDPDLFTPTYDQGWAYGTAGIAGALPDRLQLLNLNLNTGKGVDLFQGIAGLGMLLLSADKTGSSTGHDYLLDEITRFLLVNPVQANLQGGLMHGDAGAFYFLLKQAGKSSTSVLYPAKELTREGAARPISLSVTDTAIKTAMLTRYFPRTCMLLEQIAPAGAGRYFQQSKESLLAGELDRFAAYIADSVLPVLAPGPRMRVKDILYLEKEKVDFFLAEDRPNLPGYLAQTTHRHEIIQLLNRPDAWLLEQKLGVSNDVRILNIQWDWTFSNEKELLRERLADNRQMPAQQLGCVLKPSNAFETAEFIMRGQAMLLLQSFATPRQVKEVLAQVRHFVQSLSKEELSQIVLQLTGANDPGEFLQELENITLYEIRIWLYEKILVIHP